MLPNGMLWSDIPGAISIVGVTIKYVASGFNPTVLDLANLFRVGRVLRLWQASTGLRVLIERDTARWHATAVQRASAHVLGLFHLCMRRGRVHSWESWAAQPKCPAWACTKITPTSGTSKGFKRTHHPVPNEHRRQLTPHIQRHNESSSGSLR